MGKNKFARIMLAVACAAVMAGCATTKDAVNVQESQEKGASGESTVQAGMPEGETDSRETQSGIKPQTDASAETEARDGAESGEAGQADAPAKAEEQDAPMTEKQSGTQTQQLPAGGSVSEADYGVSVRGTVIPLHGDMRVYIDALGEPDGYSAARSCVEAGEDKIYTYGGIAVYTYVTNGADRITLIEITGSEALMSGIHIGSTRAEVIEAYGDGFTEEAGELLYEMGGKTIGLLLENGKVSFIELFGR